jgi:nicotinate-nucleotide--dimethylbenzimidazole phosphoribosyltransferase
MSVRHFAETQLQHDDIAKSLENLPAGDADARRAAEARDAELTKPAGALGRLEDLAAWCAEWQGRHPPRLDDVQVVVFAGNHGVTARGISAFPHEVTVQMVANFEAGGAAVNQLAEAAGATLDVVALDLETPTADLSADPAMSEADCAGAFRRGFDAVRPDTDALVVGEMGIGNTTVAAALCTALWGGDAADWAGPGTGLDGDGVALKARVIADAMAVHGAALDDPLEALRRVGGREIAAMAGAALAARMNRTVVVLDGFVATAAVSVLEKMRPGALDHCVAGHVSAEPGHRRLLERLGKAPLLDLGMRLGEGSGALVALPVLRAAVAAHNGMATFAEAAVSNRE